MILEEQVHRLQVKVDRLERELEKLTVNVESHIFSNDEDNDDDGPGEIGYDGGEFYK